MTRKALALAAAALLFTSFCADLAAQPEIITITSAGAFGPLTRSAVQFPHGLHAAMPGASCASCHHHTGGAKSSIRCESCHAGKVEIRNAFHRLCIGCHDTAARQGKTAGPRTCGQCHSLGGQSRPLGGQSRPWAE
jgi:hypothetical protein